MKQISNNTYTVLHFVRSGEPITGEGNTAELQQLGSDTVKTFHVELWGGNCFTVSFSLVLEENILSNGLYMLRLINEHDTVIFTSTVEVIGNTDTNRTAYITR